MTAPEDETMSTNQHADVWATTQLHASKIAAGLNDGDYWYRWSSDEEEPGDQLADEVRKALRDRGLTLATDDVGIRVGTFERAD